MNQSDGTPEVRCPSAAGRAGVSLARRRGAPLRDQRRDRIEQLRLLVRLAEVVVDAELDGARAGLVSNARSEERRVGKEGRCAGEPWQWRKGRTGRRWGLGTNRDRGKEGML